MQTTAIAGLVQGLDPAQHTPLLPRVIAWLRARRMQADMALIDPRLREDAGLAGGAAAPPFIGTRIVSGWSAPRG